MRWLPKVLGIASKVGGIAGRFINAGGGLGKAANTIHKVAGLVSTVLPKAAPYIGIAATGLNMAYKSGLLDKMTHGGASRLVNGSKTTFGLNKPTNISNSVQSKSGPG